MKFAQVNGQKKVATKGAKGFCQYCSSEMIAHCGDDRVHHWKHKSKRNCDKWWENETEWHRLWKNSFPKDWQEVIHYDSSGEKHIADVKTLSGWILEFQHSYLKPEERLSRNAFYPKLIWVVDGTRRKRDVPQFNQCLNESLVIANNPPFFIRRINFPEECKLIEEWQESNALVFFDFQTEKEEKESMLWFLFSEIIKGEAYVSTFPKSLFIKSNNKGEFDKIVKNTILPIHLGILKRIETMHQNDKASSRLNRISVTQQFWANKLKQRKRL